MLKKEFQSHTALIFWVCLILLTSFFVHTVHFDHHHPDEFGSGVEALLHGEDRKWWFVIILAFLAPVFSVWLHTGKALLSDTDETPNKESIGLSPCRVAPLFEAFANGIIHPKLCA